MIRKFCWPAMHVQVRWVLIRQGIATLCIAALMGVVGGANAAISALLGGGIAILGALAYVWRALGNHVLDSKKAYRAQLLGETYKFAVVLGGFALVFLGYKDVAALPLFLGFALTVAVYWMALLKTRN
jgi:ATP synthase protein I